MPEWAVRIRFESDWHIGSGGGHGADLDRALLRDQDGLPYVPARTLAGLWRDAAELLAAALDARATEDHATGSWSALVPALFGRQPTLEGDPASEPIPGRVRVEPARVPDRFRAALSGSLALREALTFRSASVAIDPRTGAAAQDKFFTTELARAGNPLDARVRIDLPDVPEGDRAGIARFLRLSLAGIRAVGAGRRRGRGRCKLTVVGEPDIQQELQALLASGPPALQGNGNERRMEAEDADRQPRSSDPEAWRTYCLDVTTIEPVLVHGEVTGNVVRGADHLPGSVVLAALAGRDAEWRSAVGDAVRGGALIVGNARPRAPGSDDAALPVPLALHVEKGDTGRRSTRRLEMLASGPRRSDNAAIQYQQLRQGFVVPPAGADAEWSAVMPRRVQRTHNVIDDVLQRPTAALGGVFTYEAIAPDERLVARLRVREGHTLRTLLDSAGEFELCIGRGRKADYGRVRVRIHPVDAPGGAPASPVTSSSDDLVLVLASPLLVRDAHLAFRADVASLERLVQHAAGCSTLVLDGRRTWMRAFRLASWHGRWSLPRPELRGLDRGCVLVFTGAGAVSDATRSDLAEQGLGERRAEGYGEVVVDPPWWYASDKASRLRRTPRRRPLAWEPETAHMDALSRALKEDTAWIDAVLVAAVERSLERGIAAELVREDESSSPLGHPARRHTTVSQLGRLRSALSALSPGQDPRGIIEVWCDRGRRRRAAGDHRAPRRGKAEEWLMQLCRLDVPALWDKLLTQPTARAWCGWVRSDERLASRWANELLRRSIVDRCRQAARRDDRSSKAPEAAR